MEEQSLYELQKIKNIIHTIISLLETNINSIKNSRIEPDEEQQKLLNFLIGNKENVVSIITKLSNLLIKLNGIKDDKDDDSFDSIEAIDIELIEKFIEERRKNQTENILP
ncbi:MAG: hypothetical protein LBG48_02545 [Rickettsiales bacterium]|jgi:hypothetical protein|nr:hypothetical protein [Rickettsiales bacterium]